jgi:hypothetical protein
VLVELPQSDGRVSIREASGAFAFEYPSTWQGAHADHMRIVNATPGYPKATLEVFQAGSESYRVPRDASSFEITTGFGPLVAHRFKAPDIYGGAPYYAEVISSRFQAGGREWVIEAVLLQIRRDEMIEIVVDLLRALRPASVTSDRHLGRPDVDKPAARD